MNVLKILVVLALVGLGLLMAVLTIGAFGSVNPNNPAKFMTDIESVVSNGLHFLQGEKLAFARGFSYMGFAVVCTSIAALLVSSPKSRSLVKPGNRMRGDHGTANG